MAIHNIYEITQNYREPLTLQGFTLYNSICDSIDTSQKVYKDIYLEVDKYYQGSKPEFMVLLSLSSNSLVIDNINSQSPYIYITNDSFPENTYQFQQESFLVKYNTTLHNTEIISNGIFTGDNIIDSDNLTYYAKPIGILDSGFGVIQQGYKLNSLFYLSCLNESTNDFDKEYIQVSLTINDNTISITGGSNYQVGDTFNITSAGSTGQALLTVEQINSDTGEILSVSLFNDMTDITVAPQVVYLGQTGSGANITINDDYSIANIVSTLQRYYPVYNNVYVYAEKDGQDYITLPQSIYLDYDYDLTGVEINETEFVINDIICLSSGNNIDVDTKFYFHMNDNIYTSDNYITINFNLLQDMHNPIVTGLKFKRFPNKV
jgi:hypothetical protein